MHTTLAIAPFLMCIGYGMIRTLPESTRIEITIPAVTIGVLTSLTGVVMLLAEVFK